MAVLVPAPSFGGHPAPGLRAHPLTWLSRCRCSRRCRSISDYAQLPRAPNAFFEGIVGPHHQPADRHFVGLQDRRPGVLIRRALLQ